MGYAWLCRYAATPYQPGVDSCAVAHVTEEVAKFLARLLGPLESPGCCGLDQGWIRVAAWKGPEGVPETSAGNELQ